MILWQWCRMGSVVRVPSVPALTAPVPVMPPKSSPAWRPVPIPVMEKDGRATIIADGNTQDESRYIVRVDLIPGAIVPAA